MKLNERLYDVLGNLPYEEPAPGEDYVPKPSTPLEVQQCGKHSVEIYYMNGYKDVLKEFTAQNKFAVWSSKDGQNYRLAVEKDYYEKVKDLYTVEVNEIWLGFWDECDVIQTKFSRHIVLPVTLIVVVLFLFFANWNNMFANAKMNEAVQLGFTIGIPVIYLVVMMFLRRNVMNKIMGSQQQALVKVKEHFGESKFEQLLKTQRTYIDEYFEKEQDEELDEEAKASDNNKQLESKEAEAVDNEASLEKDETQNQETETKEELNKEDVESDDKE